MVIDTYAHLDVEDLADDLPEVISRAHEAGVGKTSLPATDLKSVDTVLAVCRQFPDTYYPMIGLQPEEVHDDWREMLDAMRERILLSLRQKVERTAGPGETMTAIGEVGLDSYWTREYEKQQPAALEETAGWSVKTRLPLMIHCRKAQGEMLHIMRPYEKELPGGIFHCFTGNQKETEVLLRFDRFVLGMGGILVFKSSRLREDFPAAISLDHIVLETDSPCMAPIPHRGKYNEGVFIVEIVRTLALSYDIGEAEFARQTNENMCRVFGTG